MKWISVDDITEKPKGDCLTFSTEGIYLACYWADVGKWLCCDPRVAQGIEVTHWMPLPKPPE